MHIPDGKENCAATLENSLAIAQNVKMLTCDLATTFLCMQPRGMKKYVHAKLVHKCS